jgi:hypothetical protein
MAQLFSLAPILLAAALTTGSTRGETDALSWPQDRASPAPAQVAASHRPVIHPIADGQSFVDGARALASKVAEICFFAAWPTAKYKSWTLQDVTPHRSGGGEITFRVFGMSAWTGKEIWVDVILTVSKDFKVTGVRWGDYSAFIPPGSTLKLLKDLSK